jgi:hypothetical protein
MLRRRAFLGFGELLLFIAIVALIIAILLPSLAKARELAKRSVCAANLSGNGKAIAMYANVYRGAFPASSKARIRGSGAAAGNPQPVPDEGSVLMFDYARAPIPAVEGGLHRWQGVVDAAYKGEARYPYVRIDGKDASYAFPSRELFLLVKQNFAQASQFVCPSTAHDQDPLWADQPEHPLPQALGVTAPSQVVPGPQLWDFLGPQYLDYGYMFGHDLDGEQANEAMDPLNPVMADSNPYIRAALAGQTPPEAGNTRNSLNHRGDGQNVLFGDLHVQFCDRPTVGVSRDNIYTWGYSRAGDRAGPDVPGQAPRVVAGPPGEPPSNYLFDIVSRTDAMLLP